MRRRRLKIKLHHEGTEIIFLIVFFLTIINGLLFAYTPNWVFDIVFVLSISFSALVINFFRSPLRIYKGEVKDLVFAPADGQIVVIEEVMENEYFHEKRLMVSVFMSIFNVHANWYPCNGQVKHVDHHDGNFLAAYLPKASTENERSMIVIETPEGHQVMARQIAGAMARRIVTYAKVGEYCDVDEHMGFIKFGSRVDVYLPLNTQLLVNVGDKVTGNQTLIARLKDQVEGAVNGSK